MQKNQTEISRNEVRMLLWPLGGGKCGKRGGGGYGIRRGENALESRIEFPNTMLIILDTPHGPNTKLLKKCLKNAGKIQEKIIFPSL